jgi:ABC-type dipeptide/oligopeptide/nickel transport system permease component
VAGSSPPIVPVVTEPDLAVVEGAVLFVATTVVLIDLTVDLLVIAMHERLRLA